MNANANLMVENVIKINDGITVNVDISVKNIYAKTFIFGILLHVVAKKENIQQVLWMIQQLSLMKV